MSAKDFLLDQNNALIIKDGDFAFGDSDGQHMKLIVMSEPGSWRQYPTVGVGLRRMGNTKINALAQLSLRKNITAQLQADGFKVNSIKTPDTKKILINAQRI